MPTLIPNDKMSALADLIARDRKIEAIKLYRELTGLGLKEAKDQVEALESSLRAKAPARFGPVPKRGGCLGGAAILCLCAVFVICWIARK